MTTATTSRFSRRYFFRLVLASGAAVAANGAWAVLVEPHWLAVERVAVPLPRLPRALDGLTVAQLSDLHCSPFVTGDMIRAAVDMANALGPDLAVITGDYVYHDVELAVDCARELARLQAPLGRFAILGNHDHWTNAQFVTRALEDASLPVLINRAVPLERAGARLWLAGIDDVWERRHDLPKALRDVPGGECTLLLAHEPDYADEAANFPVDLQLSGHSHGGQVNFPFVGPKTLPYLGTKYVAGLNYAGRLPVYTNRGTGTIAPAVRWNCRPEVTLLTLRAVG